MKSTYVYIVLETIDLGAHICGVFATKDLAIEFMQNLVAEHRASYPNRYSLKDLEGWPSKPFDVTEFPILC